jgi:hypothetical protein
MVNHLEGVMISLYKYFFNFPKRNLELVKLEETMETKGLKILNNVKTCQISMFEPIQTSVAKVLSIIVEYGIRQPYNLSCVSNLQHLVGVKSLLNLIFIILLFKCS